MLRYEICQRLSSHGLHVTICPCGTHCGMFVATARVSCIINSASPWYVFWLLSLHMGIANSRKNRGHRETGRKTLTRNTSCCTLPYLESQLVNVTAMLFFEKINVLICVYSQLQWEGSDIKIHIQLQPHHLLSGHLKQMQM